MKIFKIVIDILLFVVTVLLVNIEISGRLFHEILGITMAILVIIHTISNWKWVKQVTKNLKKVNTKTKLMYVVNLITMIAYWGSIILGILISNELFKLKTASDFKLTLVHIIFGKLAVIIMLVHIGMHLDRLFKKIKSETLKKLLYVIYSIVVVAISVYLIYTLTHSFQWMSMFSMSF